MTEWWILIGGAALQDKMKELPEDTYMKYWMGAGLLEPWRDRSMCVVIIEFFHKVHSKWITEYFEYPVAAAIDCHCKAINSIDYLKDFEYRTEKGQSTVSQITDIAERGFFITKSCCQDFIETDSE